MNRKVANQRIFKYKDSFGNKKMRKNGDNNFRKVKICTRCKRRKVKHHHYLCDSCWSVKI